MLSVKTIIYSYWEKVLKEFWVIADSSKKSFSIFRNILESQINPCFILDKNSKILYANKDGAKIISKRYHSLYKGQKKNINKFSDLVHHSSVDQVQKIVSKIAEHTIKNDDCHIAILQNFTLEDEDPQNPQDIGSLIAKNKLNYFKAKASFGNWNSGNWIVLTLENIMGELIRNKLLAGKSSCIFSWVDDLVWMLEKMYESHLSLQEISPNQWIRTLSSAYQLFEKYQTVNSILKFSYEGSEQKTECFDIMKTTKNLINILSMISTNNDYDIDLSFEMGIPDWLYGNIQSYKQIISILLSVANHEAKANLPTTWDVRFLWIDQNKNYIIGINIGIPKPRNIDEDRLSVILGNKSFSREFFKEFKDELQKYDLGIFLVGYLVETWEGKIKSYKKDDYIFVSLELPFLLSDQIERIRMAQNGKFRWNLLI